MLQKKVKLKEEERISTVVRRYGITLFWHWLIIILLFIIPFFFMFWLFNQGWWGQVLFVGPVVVGTLLALRTVYVWQTNVFIITTHRLIDIDRKGLFDTTISEVPFNQIEDISGRVKGLLSTLFKYGNLVVQTGGGKVQIVAEKIKNPHRLQQEINELRERFISKYSHDFSGNVADVIIDKLYELELLELQRVKKVLLGRVQKLKEKDGD